MVLQKWLITFSSVDRNLAGFQISLKCLSSKDSLILLFPKPFSE